MSYSNKIRNKIDSEAQERIHDCDKVPQMIATLLRLYKWCSSIRIKVVLIAKVIHPPRLTVCLLFYSSALTWIVMWFPHQNYKRVLISADCCNLTVKVN